MTRMPKRGYPIRTANYARRLGAVYLLAALVFGTGGVVAFALDNVTLPGRTGAARFEDIDAHMVGVFCFLVSAYWFSKLLEVNRASRLVRYAPYVLAVIAALALLGGKYGA